MRIVGLKGQVLGLWVCAILGSLGLIVAGLLGLGGKNGKIMVSAGLLSLALIVYVALQLRRVDTSEWLITWDMPESLQFSAYIGRQEGFSFDDSDTPHSSVEHEWRGWWRSLPGRVFRHHAQIDELLRSHADLPPLELLRVVGSPVSFDVDPPGFDSLRAQPVLQALCQKHWPGFQQQWQIEKPDMFAKMRQQGRAVREERIVRAAVRAAGQQTSAPFSLRLDFVRWPETYQQHVSDRQLVLGAQYLDAASADQLRALIAAAVVKLV